MQVNNTSGKQPFIDFNNITTWDHFKLMLKDMLGEEKAAELANDIGHFLNIFIGWRDVRPWVEFFAVFKMPQWNLGLLEQRLVSNFLHYRSNYFVLCVGIFVIRAIFSPTMLLSLTICLASAVYLLLIVKMPIVIGQFTLRYREKAISIFLVSIVFMSITRALVRLIWSILMMITVCGLHMLFRPRSVTAKTSELYEELRLNGYSWFGGGDKSDDHSADTEDPENPSSSDDTYSAVVDHDADIRKRTMSSK